MRRVVLALSALALAVPLTACANQLAGAPIGTGQTVDPNPPQTNTSSSPSPKPPTPSVADFPQAKDGTNLQACYDGTCEVELRAPVTIPLDPALGLASLTLERVDNVAGAQLVGKTTDGGTLSVSVYADPGGEATAVVNGFTFVALATVDGVAVIRMSPPG